MNKFTKIGLLLQIPNILIILVSMFLFIILKYGSSILDNLLWIILGTIFGIINIISIILIFAGMFEK